MKFVALVSSGIDSPVAAYLLAPKATELIFVHADNRPYAEEREIEKFYTLATYLKKILPAKVRAFLVPHGKALLRRTSSMRTESSPACSANG